MMAISTAITYPKFKTLSLILVIILTINSFLNKFQLFQDQYKFFLYISYISGPKPLILCILYISGP